MRIRSLFFPASAVLLTMYPFIRPTIARADSSPPYLSTTECFLRPDGGGGLSTQIAANKGTISPSGRAPSEDIHIFVTVRGEIGTRLAGATVVATAAPMGGAVFRWDDGSLPPGDSVEDPQTGLTNAQGAIDLVYDEGGVALPPSPAMPNLGFTLTTQGPGPGDPVALPSCPIPFSLLSVDLNADGRVNLTDFAIFSADYVAGNPRSDFNWDSGVNLTDLAAFTAHYRAGANLDTQ